MVDKTKAQSIIEMYNAGGTTQKDIAVSLECSEGYVSKTIALYNKSVKDASDETVENEEIEKDVNGFIKQVKIIPDKDTLTENDDEEQTTTEEYECGVCGHVWVADAKEYQKECLRCGERFD